MRCYLFQLLLTLFTFVCSLITLLCVMRCFFFNCYLAYYVVHNYFNYCWCSALFLLSIVDVSVHLLFTITLIICWRSALFLLSFLLTLFTFVCSLITLLCLGRCFFFNYCWHYLHCVVLQLLYYAYYVVSSFIIVGVVYVVLCFNYFIMCGALFLLSLLLAQCVVSPTFLVSVLRCSTLIIVGVVRCFFFNYC